MAVFPFASSYQERTLENELGQRGDSCRTTGHSGSSEQAGPPLFGPILQPQKWPRILQLIKFLPFITPAAFPAPLHEAVILFFTGSQIRKPTGQKLKWLYKGWWQTNPDPLAWQSPVYSLVLFFPWVLCFVIVSNFLFIVFYTMWGENPKKTILLGALGSTVLCCWVIQVNIFPSLGFICKWVSSTLYV
jgi:hypothetical protein